MRGQLAAACAITRRALGPGPLALVWASGLLCFAAPASADVRVAPAGDGSLGAWLVAGPVSPAAAKKLDPAQFTPEKQLPLAPGSGASWRLASHVTGALDLRARYGAPGQFAAVGGIIQVANAERAYLLVGVDGELTVWLDGRSVYQRSRTAMRGGSFEPIPIDLKAGAQRLVLWLTSPSPRWGLWARVVSVADGLPPVGLNLSLPGADQADAVSLSRALLQTRLSLNPTSSGYQPELSVLFPRGYPLPSTGAPLAVHLSLTAPSAPSEPASPAASGSAEPAQPDSTEQPARQARSGGPSTRALSVGQVQVGPRGVRDLRVSLPKLPADASGAYKLSVKLPTDTREHSHTLAPSTVHALASAEAQANRLAGGANHETLSASLSWLSAELRRAADTGEPRGIEPARRDLERLTKQLGAGQDPLTETEGVVQLARYSTLDGSPQPLSIHFPRGYTSREPSKRYPLVLLLHGYQGTPASVMRAFLDRTSPAPVVDGIVIAPNAHGNSFYRGAGEQDTIDVLSWALKTLAVDSERVSVTGVSMGGTGAGYLALRYPELFSAASPLCGYHSYFVRRDTRQRPIRPWEEARMHHWSPASWADNGRHVPFFVAQGTKDFPLENSKVLIEQLRQLKYPVTEEWPDTGHNVWEKVWAGAGMWNWLSTKRRASLPNHVSLVTDSLRYGRRYWVEVTALDTPGAQARLDARVDGAKLRIKTSGISGFRLVPPLPAAITTGDAPLQLSLDGQELSAKTPSAADGPRLVRAVSGWQLEGTTPKPGAQTKRRGAEGPIRDVFMAPVIFVYGTRRSESSRATRELAETFMLTRGSADLSYPVVSDRELSVEQRTRANLILIGGPTDNLISHQLQKSLPSRTRGSELSLGPLKFEGGAVAAIYVNPHPENPERSLVVVDAVSARGYWLTAALPQLLPDFLVYDQAILAAAGEQILSSGRVLAGGFFNRDWSLPASARDPAQINPAEKRP